MTTDPNLDLSLDMSLDPTLDLYLDPNLDLDRTLDLDRNLNLNPNKNHTVPTVEERVWNFIGAKSAELIFFVIHFVRGSGKGRKNIVKVKCNLTKNNL